MFCHKCGNKSLDGAVFCSNCGARLIREEDTPLQPQQPESLPYLDEATPDTNKEREQMDMPSENQNITEETFDATLVSIGPDKEKTVKVIQQWLGIVRPEAENLMERTPVLLKKNVPQEKAEMMQFIFEQIEANVVFADCTGRSVKITPRCKACGSLLEEGTICKACGCTYEIPPNYKGILNKAHQKKSPVNSAGKHQTISGQEMEITPLKGTLAFLLILAILCIFWGFANVFSPLERSLIVISGVALLTYLLVPEEWRNQYEKIKMLPNAEKAKMILKIVLGAIALVLVLCMIFLHLDWFLIFCVCCLIIRRFSVNYSGVLIFLLSVLFLGVLIIGTVIPGISYPGYEVRVSYMTQYSETVTVGEAFESYFEDCKWKKYKDEDYSYVVFTGTCEYMGEICDVRMTFKLTGKNFVCDRLELNGSPQSELMITILLSDVYDEYERKG